MSQPAVLNDKLMNLTAELGTGRDKSSASFYAPSLITDEQLLNAYRGAWLPRKIIDVPALDATRRWRMWQAEAEQITLIEGEEARLGLRGKIRDLMTKARLFGGAALFLGTDERNVALPLDPPRIARGGLRYLNVFNRRDLQPGEIVRDPLSPYFGRPEFYSMTAATGAAQVNIHASRLVVLQGATLPDDQAQLTASSRGWGDSVLMSLMTAIQQSDNTMANVASLIFEANIDVINVPELMQRVGESKFRADLLTRFTLAATTKGINGMLLLDKDETYTRNAAAFGGLPDLMDRFLQAVSGAADIPATRLLGQSPAGLNSTGESDLRNYYDRIQSIQELEIGPAMVVLDECLIRSALGARPPEIHYVWTSLWQPTSAERSENFKRAAEAVKILAEAGVMPAEALAEAASNMLIENGWLPGLEQALEEYGTETPDPTDNGTESDPGETQ